MRRYIIIVALLLLAGIAIGRPVGFVRDSAAFITYTLTSAVADQFKIDAQGTIAGNAINLTTTDGGVRINASGAANGDVAITAADDMTQTVAGDLTYAVTGTTSMGGAALTNKLAVIEVQDANDTLTAAESGKVIIATGVSGAGAATVQTITLPTAAAGLEFYFYDANATADADLWITAGASDTINGGTAAKSYKCTGDAVKQGLHIVAQDATSWLILSEVGTWANDNN